MIYKQEVINSQKELRMIEKNSKEILTKARYGPSKLTRIPLQLNEELAFFVGAIIGDGHLRKSKLQIVIELSDKSLIEYIKEISRVLFNRSFNINQVKPREGKKQTFTIQMDSKAIYNLLKEVFEIPSGKKSNIVIVPKQIKYSNENIKIAFLKGIMATEGGKRRRGFGLSTASRELWEGLIELFEELKIPILKDKWEHKRYKKEYYGICFKKDYMKMLMWECQSGQMGCV